MKLVESVRKDAEQKYGKERVYAILMRDNVLGMKYLIPICRFVYDEGVDVNEVFAILNRLGNRKIGNIWAMSFQEMKQAYEMNYPCDVIPLPNPVFCSSDNMVEIGQIKTWDEARKIPMCRSWCISRGKDSWEDYTINRHYRFYIIRNLRNSHNKSARYVLLAIAPNGAYDFSDSTDTNIVDGCIIPDFYKHHFMPSEYKDAIGEEGVSAIEKIIGRKISESKIMKNMKTNKRTITESQLRNIVAESIRKVLKESAFRYTNTDDFLHFLSSQGEDPMPFVYNAMKEMNLENKFDFRMGPRVVFYKIIKPNHPDIYEEIGKNMYRIWQENIAEYGI